MAWRIVCSGARVEAEQFRRAGSVFVSEDVMVAWTRVTAEERGWTR